MAATHQQTNYGKIGEQQRIGRKTNSRHLNETGSATAADRHFAREMHAAMCDVEGYWHSMVTPTRTSLFFKELPRDALDQIEAAGGSVGSFGMTKYALVVRVAPADAEGDR